MTQEQVLELLRLRGQVSVLRAQLAELHTAQEERTQPKPQATEAATDPAIEQFRQDLISKTQFTKYLMVAFRDFANNNQGKCPTNFDQAIGYLADAAKGQTNITTDQFEIVYTGCLNDLTNQGDGETIVVRLRQIYHRYDGKCGNIYGRADGSVLQRFLENETALQEWEQQYLRSTAPPQ